MWEAGKRNCKHGKKTGGLSSDVREKKKKGEVSKVGEEKKEVSNVFVWCGVGFFCQEGTRRMTWDRRPESRDDNQESWSEVHLTHRKKRRGKKR